MTYNTIIRDDILGEVTVKKSRFIAALHYVESETEADDYIKAKRKEHYSARHNCFAYIIGKGDIIRSSDDGEPSGTAGRPMLEVMKGAGLYNAVCVVTRYFGGVLLGTGGLVRAYHDAVRVAIDDGDLYETYSAQTIEIISDYNNWAQIEQFCRTSGLVIGDVSYMENVVANIEIPTEDTDDVEARIIDLSGAKVHITKKGIKDAIKKTS